MMLVRAMNDFDSESNPEENGIASKKVIYELTKKYYSNTSPEFNKLNDTEKDIFIKEHMKEYLESHKEKLKKLFTKETLSSREDGKEFKRIDSIITDMNDKKIKITNKSIPSDMNMGVYIKIYKYLSSLQQHLVSGNTNITDWISASKSFTKNQKYRDNQEIHKIALIYNHEEQLIDKNGVMFVDLSSPEKIQEQRFLCNKFLDYSEEELDEIAEKCRHDVEYFMQFEKEKVRKTKSNCRGFSYSTSSDEVCIHKYIPKEYVVGIIEGLQLDLFLEGMINPNFYLLSKNEQKKELLKLKNRIFEMIKRTKNNSLIYTYNELYNKGKNSKTIEEDEETINHNRRLILGAASMINSPLIKR